MRHRSQAAMGSGRRLLALPLLLAAACLAACPLRALAGPRHGCFYEEHMQKVLGLEDHEDLHHHIQEAARKAQERAEEVAASGAGTSHYLRWRLSQLPKSDSYSDTDSDSDVERSSHYVSLERGRMLEVMAGSVNTTALQPPGLNSPPGPADINIIPPRHGSAVAPGVVDWRASSTVSTNITDQMSHVCDCGFKKCCSGGWPEWTFQFAQLNKGVAPLSSYPYLAKDNQKCGAVNPSLLTGKITGWEKHPAADPNLLMKTVSMHPVMVLIRASATFLAYKGGVFRGTDCAKRVSVNHALVVMGFNATGSDPYWIAKNSWGTGWGEGGYIRISMLTTVCGFGTEPSMYPTMFRVKTPCDDVPSPCGKGTCYLMADQVTARCACPAGFVERLESGVPKCVSASPCASAINPCAFGTCNNEFDGTYTCRCPSGTVVGSRADGGETCVVNSFQSGLLTTTALAGDNCTTLSYTFNLTSTQLVTMNPFLNCSGPITPGTLVVVGGALSGVGCGARDAVNPNDTCSSFAAKNGISVAQLLALNPSVACAALPVSAHLCVLPGQLALSSPYERSCGVSYDTDFGDTCLSVAQEYNSSLVIFEWLNPAIDCTQPLPLTTVCVSPLMLGTAAVTCSASYNVTQADTCFSVATSAGLQLTDFLAINPGLRCYWPNWVVGLTVCIKGVAQSLADMELEPNLIPYYIRNNDTLARIAGSYVGQCNDPSGNIVDAGTLTTAICWANGWLPAECSDRWIVIGSMILIPCAKDIGATTCSAAQGSTAVSTATWLSYCCGNNGVTYISYYCASSSYAIPTVIDGAGCPACGSLCTGISGSSIAATYGGTLPGCMAKERCTFPQAPTSSQASQMCVANGAASALSQYSRYLCSMSTRLLSKIDNSNVKLTTACVNFNLCLMEAMGYKKMVTSTTYAVDTTACPWTAKLNCGTGGAAIAYDLSFCGI